MLKQIKIKTGLKGKDLAVFLDVVESTLYNWEKNDNWPSWAISKCGFTIEPKEEKEA